MKIFNRLDNYINDKKFSMIYKNNKLDIINYSKIIGCFRGYLFSL